MVVWPKSINIRRQFSSNTKLSGFKSKWLRPLRARRSYTHIKH